METSIKTELLNKWYPQSVDSIYGGFITTLLTTLNPQVHRISSSFHNHAIHGHPQKRLNYILV
jgi:hypothetical protein